MADNIFGGSREVQECYTEQLHGLCDHLIDSIKEEKIPKEIGFQALWAATSNPQIAIQMMDQYDANGAFDIAALNLQQQQA
jgi:hypothetical protein